MLLDHFIDNVLRLIFPVVEVNQNLLARSIIDTLKTNKCYLRSCLSIAAIYLKYTQGLKIDVDIFRYCQASITILYEALNRNADCQLLLEAILGMVFLQCLDDFSTNIPWLQHFKAGASLVRELQLPMDHPLVTLTSWIDILGATMIARSSIFAQVYREEQEAGTTSGLLDLMGCNDRIMYVISEIACLEGLKTTGSIDNVQLCNHVLALSEFLNQIETAFEPLNYPYSFAGTIHLKSLFTNTTAVFQIAAHVYLVSIIPGVCKHDPTILSLIDHFTAVMEYVPLDFDRSLVWPLLIAGSMSTPRSAFRKLFASRVADVEDQARVGRFSQMVRVLHEVWQQLDDIGSSVHWRDVMQLKGWNFILIWPQSKRALMLERHAARTQKFFPTNSIYQISSSHESIFVNQLFW